MNQLSDLQGRTLVLIRAYEKIRQRKQKGYKVFRKDVDIASSVFKTFQTVCEWILSQGWKVTWKEVHWQGYIEYVFKQFEPNIPHPGQLKNITHLRNYLKSGFVQENAPPIRSLDQLHDLYDRVLPKSLRSNNTVMYQLGIRRE